jgi:glycosyltransferase involved in cell wall biosynthesis
MNAIDLNNGPLVSVIVPTYNRADAVLRAIDSILRQSYPRVEAVVVDDGSSDNTADALADACRKDARVRHIRHSTNSGCAAARNTGISAAKGEYIAFLDDDDEFLPDNIRKRLAIFASNPDVDVVVSGAPACCCHDEAAQSRWIESEFRPSKVFQSCGIMCKTLAMNNIRLRSNYMEWRDFAFQVYERGLRVLLSSEVLVRINRTHKSLSGHSLAMLSSALNNAKIYYEASRGREEHAVFRHYLANCYKNMGNFSLKKGMLWNAIGGYVNSYRTERKLQNLIPFA